MERGSHGVSGGADDGSSGASGGVDDKDKGSDSNRRVNESEGEEYSEFEADTLSHSAAYSGRVFHIAESAMKEELPDSESEGATSGPLTSPRGTKDSESNRKEKGRITYSDDFSYLNSLSRQERRRIEGEIIKGHKLGECIIILSVTQYHRTCFYCVVCLLGRSGQTGNPVIARVEPHIVL